MNSKHLKWGTFLVVLVCVAYGFHVWYWWDAPMDKKGQLGDSFGAVTSLFTVLTFFYFVYTIDLQRQQLVYQKKDFRLQLKELQQTREELKKQAIAQQKSEEALREQIEKQVLSTLLSSYTSRFNALINQKNAEYAMNHALYTFTELNEELKILKQKINALETKLEAQT